MSKFTDVCWHCGQIGTPKRLTTSPGTSKHNDVRTGGHLMSTICVLSRLATHMAAQGWIWLDAEEHYAFKQAHLQALWDDAPGDNDGHLEATDAHDKFLGDGLPHHEPVLTYLFDSVACSWIVPHASGKGYTSHWIDQNRQLFVREEHAEYLLVELDGAAREALAFAIEAHHLFRRENYQPEPGLYHTTKIIPLWQYFARASGAARDVNTEEFGMFWGRYRHRDTRTQLWHPWVNLRGMSLALTHEAASP